ncbi:MAG: nucleotidyltransferase domain-containing protein [Marinifilaceae bacterium]
MEEMLLNTGLSDNEIRLLKDIFSRYVGIERVILYGSRAKGNYRSGSDVDITIIGQSITKYDLNNIINDIDDLLLPYFFDISLLQQINSQDLLQHIHRVGKVLYEKH